MKTLAGYVSKIVTAGLLSVLPAVCSADNVSFNYQGTIKVQGQAYTGQGEFKFAILNTPGSAVLWSNDGTVGTGSGPQNTPVPATSLSLPVTDGVFSIQVGDPSVPGMSPLDSAVMVSNSPLRLRVWFSDNANGFQELKPDHKLIDLTLTNIQTGETDYTIYVNDATGNDANNGLTSATAKKTITGAVNILPDKIRCNITVDVADGTYKESVRLHGISVIPGKLLSFIGDADWITSVGTPLVRITGADSDSPGSPARDNGIIAAQCSGITFNGFALDRFSKEAINLDNGNYTVDNCKVTSSGIGILVTNSSAFLNNFHASNNTNDGIYGSRQTTLLITHASAQHNGVSGLRINANSTANLKGHGNFSFNGQYGYQVQHHSSIVFSLAEPKYKGVVTNNTVAGMALQFQSYSENHTVNTFTNNPQPIVTVYGSMTTY